MIPFSIYLFSNTSNHTNLSIILPLLLLLSEDMAIITAIAEAREYFTIKAIRNWFFGFNYGFQIMFMDLIMVMLLFVKSIVVMMTVLKMGKITVTSNHFCRSVLCIDCLFERKFIFRMCDRAKENEQKTIYKGRYRVTCDL